MWGVIFFTPILWGIPLILPHSLAVFKNLIYGFLLMVILIIRPEGVIDKNALRFIRANISVVFEKFFVRSPDAS